MPGLTALMETPVERPVPAPASAPASADESADRALVRLAQSGDLGAFDELVARDGRFATLARAQFMAPEAPAKDAAGVG